MKFVSLAAIALTLAAAQPVGAASAAGEAPRGVPYTLPDWFKPSFLDLREDVKEARARGRNVMLFLHLDNCPYCARMLKENFESGPNRDFMQKHFDVIAVNVRGNLDVTWVDGTAYTELTLARHLKAVATPTIVFLGPDGRIVVQLTGYQDPATLRSTLQYVQRGSYRKKL